MQLSALKPTYTPLHFGKKNDSKLSPEELTYWHHYLRPKINQILNHYESEGIDAQILLKVAGLTSNLKGLFAEHSKKNPSKGSLQQLSQVILLPATELIKRAKEFKDKAVTTKKEARRHFANQYKSSFSKKTLAPEHLTELKNIKERLQSGIASSTPEFNIAYLVLKEWIAYLKTAKAQNQEFKVETLVATLDETKGKQIGKAAIANAITTLLATDTGKVALRARPAKGIALTSKPKLRRTGFEQKLAYIKYILGKKLSEGITEVTTDTIRDALNTTSEVKPRDWDRLPLRLLETEGDIKWRRNPGGDNRDAGTIEIQKTLALPKNETKLKKLQRKVTQYRNNNFREISLLPNLYIKHLKRSFKKGLTHFKDNQFAKWAGIHVGTLSREISAYKKRNKRFKIILEQFLTGKRGGKGLELKTTQEHIHPAA